MTTPAKDDFPGMTPWLWHYFGECLPDCEYCNHDGEKADPETVTHDTGEDHE